MSHQQSSTLLDPLASLGSKGSAGLLLRYVGLLKKRIALQNHVIVTFTFYFIHLLGLTGSIWPKQSPKWWPHWHWACIGVPFFSVRLVTRQDILNTLKLKQWYLLEISSFKQFCVINSRKQRYTLLKWSTANDDFWFFFNLFYISNLINSKWQPGGQVAGSLYQLSNQISHLLQIHMFEPNRCLLD